MSTSPISASWVPLWPKEAPASEIPPSVDGKWLRNPPSWEVIPGLVVPDTGWHIVGAAGEPPYQNGWNIWADGNYAPSRFRRTVDGLVLLEGLITGGTPGVPAFTLPPGYRPNFQADNTGRIGHVLTGTNYPSVGWGTFHVYSTGEVNCSVPAGYWIALNNIMFYAGPTEFNFKPSDLTGLAIHLDGSQLALADGATVNDWPNLAYNGQPPTWEGAGRPTVKATARGNVVKFTASTGTLLNFMPNVGQTFTLVYYARMTGPTYARVVSSYHHGYHDGIFGFWSTYQDSLYINGVWAANGQGSAVDTNWKIYGVRSDVSSINLYKDSGHVTGIANPSGNLGGFQINGYNGSGERSDFEIAELVVYDRKLSNDDRLQVENYFRRKWIY